ncbi:hypothetical protein LO763_17515 [Glycomyces sp. A-F 0318]|uniref:hypothetical protein n=1 Tax=Glycomyces amatae TaxID=2881355 RepID=UPI001E474EFD|nr:hypothetical protein [Glycomyces amatae]MCD0445413.1 hypothetical protein [Glycomyces amatae]
MTATRAQLLRAVIESRRGGAGLPAIGRPATQALRQEGVTTLDQVAAWSEQELLALHGVGPKAVRILTEALERRGGALRS